MRATTTAAFTPALLAAILLTLAMPAYAGVRDHRTNATGTTGAAGSPPPAVNRPGQAAADKTTNTGGVTITSHARPKREKVCFLGCTSNETVVKIAKRATGKG